MKREREEVLISSDSDDEDQEDGSEEDWEEDVDDTDVEDIDDDDDEEEEEEEEDDDDDDDDDDEDSEENAYDNKLSSDEDENENDAHSSDSEQLLGSKAEKRVTSGIYGTRSAESAHQGKKWTRQKHKRMKKSGRAGCKTILSKEDENLFSEALNIIKRGDLEKLQLEHCKAYLRRYSLRLAGSKSILCDRVREHIELEAHGGMAKYPRSTFTVNCTGDACTGDIVLFTKKVKRNYYKAGTSSGPRVVNQTVAGRIVKESYGSDKQQHTFTVEVLWSKGPKHFPFLNPLLIKGRNLYRYNTFRQRWRNEGERKRVLQEKHSRGDVARDARECRVSGKAYSCPGSRRIGKSRAKITMRRGSKDISYKESMTSVVRSFAKDRDGRAHETIRILTIKACYAGRLIGAQGRNIGAIQTASGAQLRVRDHPSSPTLRMVEIVGAFEQVQVATQMVIQSFLSQGLPPPMETS